MEIKKKIFTEIVAFLHISTNNSQPNRITNKLSLLREITSFTCSDYLVQFLHTQDQIV